MFQWLGSSETGLIMDVNEILVENSALENRNDSDVVNELNIRLARISVEVEKHRIRIQNLFSFATIVGCLIGAYTIGFLFFGSTNFFFAGSFCLLLSALAVLLIKKYDDRKSRLHKKEADEIHAELTDIVWKYFSVGQNDQGEQQHGG